jgi:hypothetical protein
MNEAGAKKGRLLTAAVIVLSVAGILYFGYRAIRLNIQRTSLNPFEYDIEEYKKIDPELVHFYEAGQIPVPLQSPHGLAVGPEDEIYVSGDSAVLVFNSSGTSLPSLSPGAPVNCLTVDSSGDIYMGRTDHIEVFDREGTLKSRWKSLGEESIITSIALTEKFVFVADAGRTIVWKCDKKGLKLQGIGQKDETKDIPGFVIPSPYFDVAIDPDGFLWAANTGRHSLENYTLQGDFRTSWGEFSMEIEGFCGCCNPTHFAFLEDGSFVTAEKGIPRIKVYNRIGNISSIVAGPDQFAEGTVGLDLAVDSKQRILVLDPFQKKVRIYEKKSDQANHVAANFVKSSD